MIIRILGINIPENKHVLIALTNIHGIGKSLSFKICKKLNIPHNIKMSNLLNEDIEKIRQELSNYTIEGDLIRETSFNIKKLIDIKSYRGYRHKRKLPSRGQRTKTNAKTCKKIRRL